MHSDVIGEDSIREQLIPISLFVCYILGNHGSDGLVQPFYGTITFGMVSGDL